MTLDEEKNQLLKQKDDLKNQLKPIDDRLHEIYKLELDSVEEKLKRCYAGVDKFSPDELIFSAFTRCDCGAGLAYPKNTSPHDCWDCADILLGRAIHAGKEGAKQHTGALPFAFYEIKSEQQPSAEGATTRPKE